MQQCIMLYHLTCVSHTMSHHGVLCTLTFRKIVSVRERRCAGTTKCVHTRHFHWVWCVLPTSKCAFTTTFIRVCIYRLLQCV